MSKVQKLLLVKKQRLTAEEIFALLEKRIAELEEELSLSKEENKRLQKLLDAVSQPQLRIHRAESTTMEDGLFDIPDYNTIEDEALPPLPPPHSPGGQENGDPFGNGVLAALSLSLLADICCKIRAQAQAQAQTQAQALVPQQLELVPAQFTGSGWQIITAAPTMAKENTNQPVAVTVATTLAYDSSAGGRKVDAVAGINCIPNAGGEVQANGLQHQIDTAGSMQQVIVGQMEHQFLQQIQLQPQSQAQGQQQQQQHIETIQLAPGQTLQPIQAFQNSAQVLIRTPTLSHSGQMAWQTLQLPGGFSLQGGLGTAMPQQLTLAPISGGTAVGSGGLVSLSGEPLSAAQINPGSGVQTVSIAGLGTAGVQEQGVPLTVTGLQGQPQGQDGVKVQWSPVTVAVGNLASGSWMSPDRLGSVQSSSGLEGLPNKRRRRVACSCPNCWDGEGRTSRDPTKKKQHICHMEGCAKVYGKTSHLRAHLRWHTGERPFVCNWTFCGRRFTRNDKLQRHRTSHTGEKRLECPECSKRFMRGDHLSKHIKTHRNKKGGAAVAIITTDDMEDDAPEDLDASPQIVATHSCDSDPATPTTSNHMEEGEEGEFE